MAVLACVGDGAQFGSLQRWCPLSPHGMHGRKCHTLKRRWSDREGMGGGQKGTEGEKEKGRREKGRREKGKEKGRGKG